MKKFNVGDRVKVYGNTGINHKRCGSFLHGDKGTVVSGYLGLEFESEVNVALDGNGIIPSSTHIFHPYQCRKLRNSSRIWLPKSDDKWVSLLGRDSFMRWGTTRPDDSIKQEYVEYVKVRKKTK